MPNTPKPTDRPDVEGIAEAAWDVDAFLAVRKDIPDLIEYIEALEDTLRRFDVPLHGDQGDPLISVVFMYDRDSASIVLGPELIATVKGILMNADPALAALDGGGDG